ncbi:hypothetical protein S83_063383 [Arachis hypogaea]|uniref:Transmembrane protein n=1 Tax=Arachis hypogaea TaxID=3818 RepID=A0A444Y113_ARAHY|nr:uncharacterized protein DS421_18g624600 [Arachis hypogaea]RYQ95615.1 hypothetical protein Ahy_B08g090966 [Arachis hypogaea]
MASLTLSVSAATATTQSQLTLLRFHRRFPSTHSIPLLKLTPLITPSSSFGCKGFKTRLQINQRPLTICATNPNSSGKQLPNEGSNSNSKETSNAGQGPPLLTILAGLFVFFIVCWVIGSIIMWLVSLIVNLSPK